MRFKLFPAPFLCALSLLGSVVCGAQTTAPLQITEQGHLVVQVSINGSGPHPFLLDTGSNKTLVRDGLLGDLKIPAGTLITSNMTTGVGYLHQTVASCVAIAGLPVLDLEVEGIDAAQLAHLGPSVEGVLGENFLKHFDLMIDNKAKTLTLDRASNLADSLGGRHLPLSFSGTIDGRPTADRLIFDLNLPSSTQTTHFLIDSGSNYAILFPSKPLPFLRRTGFGSTLHSFVGSARCQAEEITLEIGDNIRVGVGLSSCPGIRSRVDVDGLLPTSTFKRLFISHSGAYAIANPRMRKPSGSSRFRVSSGDESRAAAPGTCEIWGMAR